MSKLCLFGFLWFHVISGKVINSANVIFHNENKITYSMTFVVGWQATKNGMLSTKAALLHE